jgi:hypothetical protein
MEDNACCQDAQTNLRPVEHRAAKCHLPTKLTQVRSCGRGNKCRNLWRIEKRNCNEQRHVKTQAEVANLHREQVNYENDGRPE